MFIELDGAYYRTLDIQAFEILKTEEPKIKLIFTDGKEFIKEFSNESEGSTFLNTYFQDFFCFQDLTSFNLSYVTSILSLITNKIVVTFEGGHKVIFEYEDKASRDAVLSDLNELEVGFNFSVETTPTPNPDEEELPVPQLTFTPAEGIISTDFPFEKGIDDSWSIKKVDDIDVSHYSNLQGTVVPFGTVNLGLTDVSVNDISVTYGDHVSANKELDGEDVTQMEIASSLESGPILRLKAKSSDLRVTNKHPQCYIIKYKNQRIAYLYISI